MPPNAGQTELDFPKENKNKNFTMMKYGETFYGFHLTHQIKSIRLSLTTPKERKSESRFHRDASCVSNVVCKAAYAH